MALVIPVAYSFIDVNCVIRGPGCNLILSEEGVADEGITTAMTGDQSTMTTGATRGGMQSLHATRAGRITIRFLKNSPMVGRLTSVMNYQFSSGAYHGQNQITISNLKSGDEVNCIGCAFVRHPDIAWAKVGNVMEIMLDSLDIDRQLGSYTLQLSDD